MHEDSHEKHALHASYFSVIGNIALALIKWLAGFFGNSYALIADAIESTTDTFASLLVLLGVKYANRPADQNHPYGHGRIEPLVTFIVVGFLIVSATVIAYESISNIRTEHAPPASWTLWVLGAIILWKELSFQFVIKKSKITNSSVLKAEAWHHRSDAITSIAAFIGISLALLLGEGYENLDDWAALFAAGIIFYNSYRIFRPALGEIMDENVYESVIVDIKKEALNVEGVIDTEKCFVRKIGMKYQVDLHVIVDGTITVEKGHFIGHNVTDHLMAEFPSIRYVLVHIEPNTR